MEANETLITTPPTESRPTSKRVQFSRSKSDADLSSAGNTNETRQTKSARTRSTVKSRKRFHSEGKITPTIHGNGVSPRQQNIMLRLALKSRDSRRSKDESKHSTPSPGFRRVSSTKSFESSASIARRERDERLRFKFKMWTHTLAYFTRLHQKIIRNNQELEAYKKQMDYTEVNFVSSYDSKEDSVHMGLDVDHFKPVTKIRMSKEAKRILLKDPDERTPDEIKHVKTDLMVTKTESIQTLPEDCQLRLARNVGLESLGSKRFIIKEGYAAEYCYLIIVGSVIRASLDEGHVRAVSDDVPLREGQIFGEQEMESRSPRKASYISASYTEILRITAEDYNDIFLAGHNVRRDDILLLRQIDIFSGWNLEEIKSDREKIKRKFFPYVMAFDQSKLHNSIETTPLTNSSYLIVSPRCPFTLGNNWFIHEREYDYEDLEDKKPQDSRTFEWIYIVKSGSLQIMKLFDKVKHAVNMVSGNYTHKPKSNGYLEFLTKDMEYDRCTANRGLQSRPQTASSSLSTQFDRNSVPILRRLQRLLRPHTTGSEQRLLHTPDSLRNKKIPTSAISSKLVSIPKRRRQSMHPRREQSTLTDTPETNREDSFLTDDRVTGSQKEGFESRLDKTSSSMTDYDSREVESRKKHVTIEDGNPKQQTEEESRILCKIKTLTKGDVFGLEYIVFDVMDEKNQPGFLLKSNGSECLMINKKVYRDLIEDNFDLKEKLRSDVSPYPEDDDLKENFLTRTNWDVHKDILLRNIMTDKTKLKPQKHGQKFAPVRLK